MIEVREKIDVAIIGAGIAGYMAAYEIAKETKLSIALVEQGNSDDLCFR